MPNTPTRQRQTRRRTPGIAQLLPAEKFYLLDPKDRRPYIIFGPIIATALILGAPTAFAVIGFLGYASDNSDGKEFYLFSHPAWALFALFGAITLIALWTVFERLPKTKGLQKGAPDNTDKLIQRWKWEMTVVTVLCMAAEALVYMQPSLLSHLWNGGGALGAATSNGRLIWNLGNIVIIVVYAVDRVWQWRTGERMASITLPNDINPSSKKPIKLFGLSLSKWQLVSQDIFAIAVLYIALGFVVQSLVLKYLLQPFAGKQVDSCTVSWLLGACQGEGSTGNPPTLHTIDLIGGGAALIVSLIILIVVLIVRIFYVARDMEFAEAVVKAVLEIVDSVRILLQVFFPNLRVVIWPILIAAGTTAAGISARLLQMYLHILSSRGTCIGATLCPDMSEFAFFWKPPDMAAFQSYSFVLALAILTLALLFGLFGAFSILLATRVVLLKRVKGALWGNWLRFVGVTAILIICTFWLFSLMLSALNWVLLTANLTARIPFPQPGISTSVSFVFLIIALAVFVARQRRQGKTWRDIYNALRGKTANSAILTDQND